MKLPLGWLAEWIDLPDDRDALLERLTLAGLEIEDVVFTGPALDGVVVGRVLEREAHPNADRLSVCRVDCGEAEAVEVVCGAPNVAAGQKIAFAPVGTRLPDGTKLKKSKIRGVVSRGMICSARELGLGDDHEGILVLDADAAIGAALRDALPGGDTVVDFEITPNRGDWASLLGMAREVRAHFGGSLRIPSCAPAEAGAPACEAVQVRVEDGAGCFHYAARVIRGVRVGPSPPELVARLESVGLRSVNNVVDATNVAMLELGQPLHAFDLARIGGGEIRVRAATEGERIVTLDGVERSLTADDLVIADASGPVALAGVMGGAESEVRDGTTDLLLESAHFAPSRVRRTARRLGLRSDASYRFERGVDREGVLRAADRAAVWLAELAGGELAPGVVEDRGDPAPHCGAVELDPARANGLLGTDLDGEAMVACLGRVDIAAEPAADGRLRCTIPSYRNDIQIEADLIEEVARVHGYDRIPTTLPEGALIPARVPRQRQLEERARDALSGAGLLEVMTLPFDRADVSDALELPADDSRRRSVRLENPIVQDEDRLRTSSVPGLLRVVQRNLARQVHPVRVFEVARTFLASGSGLPEERAVAAVAITRGEEVGLWQARQQPPLFFEARGIAEQLVEALHVDAAFAPGDAEPYLHPGASCSIETRKGRVGAVGCLHPKVAAAFRLDTECAVIELDLTALEALPAPEIRYRDVSRHPAVRRDLAVMVAREQPAGDLLEAIRKTGGQELQAAEIFDRYEGEGVPEGKVSLAFRLVFQRQDRTLTDAEVAKMTDRVVQMLARRFGGELR